MPAISSAGLGSGLDVQSIVSQLMAIERQPLLRLRFRQDQIQSQISAFGQLSSSLSAFQDAMDKLDSLSALKVFKTSSSNPEVIDATATSSANLGDFNIEVIRLAENHKMSSAEIAGTDTFGGGVGDSVNIQVGSDPAALLTVDLSTAMTLADIRSAINEQTDNPGVQATIINGSNGNQKLIISSEDSGADNALTLSYGGTINSATLGFQTTNDIGGDLGLLDAELSIDGYTLTRSSNTISDAISGVTLNLVSAQPGVEHTLSIGRDLEAVRESVQSFADAFNELRGSIKAQRNGELEADGSLLSIERRLFGVLNTAATGGVFSTLSEVGLSIQKDGTMSLDSADLDAALNSDFDGLADLFAADGQGFANRLNSMVNGFLTTDGLVQTRTDSLNARIADLTDRQASFERNLELIEARYRAQFTALDELIGRLQGTGQFLTQQLANLPGTNN